ncbi:MAG: ATP-binding protein [Cyclobacteriaceae bacterium]
MNKSKNQFYISLFLLYIIQLITSFFLLDNLLIFGGLSLFSLIPFILFFSVLNKRDKQYIRRVTQENENKANALYALNKREKEILEILEKEKKLKKYSHQLLKKVREFESSKNNQSIDVVPTPFILLNGDAVVVDMNTNALDFLGYHKNEILKADLSKFFNLNNLQSPTWTNQLLTSNNKTQDIEVILSNNTTVWARVLIEEINDEKYKYALNLIDISDLKTSSETLKESLDRAKIAETELKSFVDKQLETNEQLLIAENQLRSLLEKEQESKAVLNQAINALKDTQGQLVHSEKMASLGQLTAGIAHEINNPINFIYNGIESLKQSLRDLSIILDLYTEYDRTKEATTLSRIQALKEELQYDYLREDLDEMLVDIKEGAVRTIEIVKGLRIFSRLDEEAEKEANINECLDATSVLLNNKMKNRVTLKKNMDHDIPEINCFPGQLNQVFMNIISNAIQAFKDEQEICEITISTVQTSENITISIRDNGSGMTEETKNRLFEPFYTTKPVGVGTGLGLSISYGIIEKHHGKISVISELGEGTEFLIELPKNLKTQYAKASGYGA